MTCSDGPMGYAASRGLPDAPHACRRFDPLQRSMRRRRLRDIFVPEGSVLLQHLHGDAASGAAGEPGVPDRAANGVALIWETAEHIAAIDEGLKSEPGFLEWDRTLTITSQRLPTGAFTKIEAGGVTDAAAKENFASRVVGTLRDSQEVYFLSLDADRAYPLKNINFNEVAQAYEIDWEGLEYTRGRSYRTTTTIYDEWLSHQHR